MKKYETFLAGKIFKSNKKRNYIIIFTLFFSTALALLAMYLMQIIEATNDYNNKREFETEAEAVYLGASHDDYDKLKQCNIFDDVSYGESITKLVDRNGKYVVSKFCFYEDQALDWLVGDLIQGNWPEMRDEIVISSSFKQDFGDIEVGKSIYLEYFHKEFTVCGIYDGNSNSVFFAKEFWNSLDKTDSLVGSVYVRFSFSENIDSMLSNACIGACGYEISHINNPVFAKEDGSGFNIRIVILLVLSTIQFVFVYSIYYFSLVKDLKLYSSFRLLGMSKAQVTKIVNLQGIRQFCIGVPLGIAAGLSGCVMIWIQSNIHQGMYLEFSPPMFTNVILVTLTTALAVYCGTHGPIKMMNRLTGFQASRYTTSFKVYKNKKRKLTLYGMAWRNIQRNKKRSVLVGICVFLLSMIFVLSNDLIASISSYDDYLYNIQDDFVVGGQHILFQLSKYEGVEQDAAMEMYDKMRWPFPVVNDRYVENIDFYKVEKIKNECVDEKVRYYFFNYAAISNEEYLNRINDAIHEKKYCIEQEEYYKRLINAFRCVPQQQYYIDFSELEKCEVVEGNLDKELFETGRYCVLIQDDSIQKESIYHVGEKIPIGDLDFNLNYYLISDNSEENAYCEREAEVMAIVTNVPSMYVVTGQNACFLSICNEDIWQNSNITLYGITLNSENLERTEVLLEEIIGTEDKQWSEMAYLSNEVVKSKKSRDLGFYRFIFGILGCIFGIAGIINLINNVIIGIVERKKELQTLNALGMTTKQIVNLIRMENMIIVGAGGIIGYICAKMLSRNFIIFVYENYTNFENYISYNNWIGLMFIGILVLLSALYPNKNLKL